MTKRLTKLLIITGPTASGKSDLAFKLSQDFGFEIISADSLLVYKHMDIGTAKPGKDILSSIPHHLIDIMEPSEEFNAGIFNKLSLPIIDRLNTLNKKILIVGGTYLYIKTLTEGLIDSAEVDREFRKNLKIDREIHGNKYIYNKLKAVDPISAEKININDYVRMERALEVYHVTGERMSQLQTEHGFKERKFNILKIGIKIHSDELRRRIEYRTNKMIEDGLIKEVDKLKLMGYGRNTKPLNSIGYKEVMDYLDGKLDIDMLKEKIYTNTGRLAKKQMTWLKRDKEINWFHFPEQYDEIRNKIEMFFG